MAFTATLLLSSVALPLQSPATSHHRASATGGVRLLASSRSGVAQAQPMWRQLAEPQAQTGGRRRGGVVCEVAVELGGSRSSGGEERKAEAGARIRVRHDGPLKVYHVPKHPELDINGMEGEVKDVVTTFKGKPISATLPYKVQMVLEQGEDRRKFFVHLKADEFEVVE